MVDERIGYIPTTVGQLSSKLLLQNANQLML